MQNRTTQNQLNRKNPTT